LIAEVDELNWTLGWDETLTRLLGDSPEVSAAIVEIDKARVAVTRARVEPIPNITGQVLAQYDAASNTAIAGAQVTVPLPLWNRNQGGVAKAGDLAAASRGSTLSSCGSSAI
jgi:cobalt-zinc-cadmium efflux system outer membrane protein